MDYELLKYASRAIVTHLNNDYSRFNIYKSKAMNLYKEVEFDDRCSYEVRILVPSDIENKLMDMVS